MSSRSEVYIDPFVPNVRIRETQPFISDGMIKRCTGCHYDEETHSVVVDYEDYNLYQVVQESESQAGLNAMQDLLKRGQAQPEDFYDNGKNGIDTTKIPTDPAVALKLANEEHDKVAALAKALGFEDGDEITMEQFERSLTDRIKAIWQAEQNAKTTGGDVK